MNEQFSIEDVQSYGRKITGIIHIGGHYAEEAFLYAAVDCPVVWVEGHPEYAEKMIQRLETFPGQVGYQALISDVEEEVDFYITADEFASSMLKPKEHQIENPHAKTTGTIRLKTTTWSKFVEENAINLANYNTLVLDVQGAELKVLKSIGRDLDYFDMIATEYSTVEFYENVPRLEHLEKWLRQFNRVIPAPNSDLMKHADALFIRRGA